MSTSFFSGTRVVGCAVAVDFGFFIMPLAALGTLAPPFCAEAAALAVAAGFASSAGFFGSSPFASAGFFGSSCFGSSFGSTYVSA